VEVSSLPRFPVPPPLYFAAGFAAGLALDRLVPLDLPAMQTVAVIGWTLIAVAVVVVGSAIFLFRTARTSLLPYRPATAFVTGGPYRFSRNPMYLSLVLAYTGLSFIFQILGPLLVLPAVIWLVQELVIRAEEKHLRQQFGEQYIRYTCRVRRWI
jgi:protein-S-isoprenylcysteine O-methyltransferase Ste14